MKKLFWGLIIACLCTLIGEISAQEPPPPYDDDDVRMVYYESENPQGLNFECLETFIRLNPSININNIPYGTKIYLPREERCYLFEDSINYNYWSYGRPKRLKFYENGQWLDTPYYSDRVIYLSSWNIKRGQDRSFTVQDIADYLNVCVDELLAENYLLAYHFEEYRRYYGYSMDIFVPNTWSPCRQYTHQRQKTKRYPYSNTQPVQKINLDGDAIQFSSFYQLPTTLSKTYGVCIEEVMNSTLLLRFFSPNSRENPVDIYLPKHAPKCYNKNGQRLTYYDENGQRLETPIYSDLPVYLTNYGDTIPLIAQKFNVCIVDLLRINQFPDIPTDIAIELFIPPQRPCPTDIQAMQLATASLHMASFITNICLETMMEFNVGLPDRIFVDMTTTSSLEYKKHWFAIKTDQPPCYKRYFIQRGESIYQAEKSLNTCVEEFSFVQTQSNYFSFDTFEEVIRRDGVYLFAPIDAPPCYNENSQRLIYPTQKGDVVYSDWNDIINRETPTYSELVAYLPEFSESVYDISQKFNVCVKDLLEKNPFLKNRIPRNHYVFIPQTRPCYDEETRMPLIYEDENGNPLPEPIVGEQLIHYGAPQFEHLRYYYNVCDNRISDVNDNKWDENGNARYLGYIIPTDRPHCYDKNWGYAEYVCYNQPVDFDTDYRHANPPLTFDINGTNCYDLKEPNTVIWYQGNPYKIQYYKGTPFESRLFTAWCFGLTMQDIYTINADKDFLPILPLYTRAIPLPTRDCYVENPGILAGKTIHTVEYGENITSIGDKYGVPYPFISVANNLGINNTIWVGQKLIIPSPPTTNDWWWLLPLWALWILLLIGFGRRIFIRIRQEKMVS
jgi:LysM repeat protein